MSRRILSSLSGLAFAGALFLLAGCEEQSSPPPPKDSKAPEAPSKKSDEPKKTSSAITGAASTIAAAATDAAKEAIKCGKEGCTAPGLPTKTLAHAGKTVHFCCDNCLNGYKKANNIQ
jgi:hypothetical protein